MTSPRNQLATVCCIGSDALALHFRKQMLKRKGYRVVTATNANDGLNVFTREAVDVVVLDQSLDGDDAQLVAGQMRGQRPSIPIILLSEEPRQLDGTLALVDAVVSESRGMELLMGAVHDILQKSRHHLPA